MRHFLLLVAPAFFLNAQPTWATDRYAANFYLSSPSDYLGREIRLRVASLTPVPELTAADQGFVWMEAVTGRPQKEEGKILLRIPTGDSAKIAKTMNLPSSSGRWLEGVFSGHDSGAVLSTLIKQKAPYYVQVSSSAAQKEELENMETASGSLVLTPPSRDTKRQEKTSAVTPPQPAIRATSSPKKEPEGPKVVLLRVKTGEPLQLRTAKSVKIEADFCEIVDQDGKLSLVGRPLVAAILPLPMEGSIPTRGEIEAAVRLYAEKEQALPEAAPLLAEAKASWEKLSASPAATTASAALPELEDVETAAGTEEPVAETGYPSWFGWGTVALTLVLIFLAWIWSRPRSYMT